MAPVTSSDTLRGVPTQTRSPAGRARRSREESQAATKAEVLRAAESVFLAKGYADAGVEEIAGLAGFTKGAVYSNFGSKEGLFLEVSTARDERLSQPLIAGLAAAADLDGCLQALDRWYRETIVKDRGWALATAEFTLVALRKPDLHALLRANHRQAVDSIAWLLASQMAAMGHELPTDVHVLAEVVVALGNGLAVTHAIDDEVSADVFLPAFRALIGLAPGS